MLSKITFATAAMLAGTVFSAAGTPNFALIPIPEKIEIVAGTPCNLAKIDVICTDDSLYEAAKFFQQNYKKHFGKTLPITQNSLLRGNVISFREERVPAKNRSRESYKIKISERSIIVTGTPAGAFYGAGTLAQLFREKSVPAMKISDSPAFPHRGLMVDVARNFLPLDDLKKFVEIMAKFKFNTLHLHLADDQGWRVEIRGNAFKNLTKIGAAKNKPAGSRGFYTQAEIRELVDFAAKNFVEIVPEIDVPGHSMAAISAFPQLACEGVPANEIGVWERAGVSEILLCPSNPKVFEFYDEIFKQLCELFPSKKFHLGGDEAPTKSWQNCPRCQKFMRENGLKNPQDLMAKFFERAAGTLKKIGKTPLFWTELDVPEYPENAVFYAWRMGLRERVLARAATENRRVVLTPGEHAYLDYPENPGDDNHGWMPRISLAQAYEFRVPADIDGNAKILGIEGLLWSEHIPDLPALLKKAFPRALALAEVAWTRTENRPDFADFERRAGTRMEEMKRER